MHALVGHFTLDPTKLDAQRRELEERVVPLMRHQPGFVSATWSVDVAAQRGLSVIVFESERLARTLVDFVREQAQRASATGARLDSIAVVEVLATANK
jgi:hypothetical protein